MERAAGDTRSRTYRAQFPCWLLAGSWVVPALFGLLLLVGPGSGAAARLTGVVITAGSGSLCWRAARARVTVGPDGLAAYGFFRTHHVAWPAVERVALLEDRTSVLPVWTRPLVVLHGGRRISLEMVRSSSVGHRQGAPLATVVARDVADTREADIRAAEIRAPDPAG